MQPNFYMVRDDVADTWRLCGKGGSPCMTAGSLERALAVAERLAAVKPNQLNWPVPVWHVVSHDEPTATWHGKLTRAGEWIERN